MLAITISEACVTKSQSVGRGEEFPSVCCTEHVCDSLGLYAIVAKPISSFAADKPRIKKHL